MSEKNWLHDVPEGQERVYPRKGNEPNDYYKECPRLGVNVLVDIDGKCTRQPKEPICGGCICLGLRDVTNEQLGRRG